MTTRRRALCLLELALSFLPGAIPARAQEARPPAGGPPIQVHGQIRSRLEMWDWFGADRGSSYAYLGSTARMSLGQTRKNLDWQVEFAGPILLGLPEDAILPGAQGQAGLGATYYASNYKSRNAVMAFPKQVFLRFKNLGGSAPQSLRIGRFEFSDGAEVVPRDTTLAAMKRDRIAARLIGTFAFTHVGRSFDGAHYVYNTPQTNFTLVGALPTRGVFQVDGWGVNKTGLLYGALTRQIIRNGHSGEVRLFGAYYHDWRRVLKTDNRPLSLRQSDRDSIRVGTYGGHYLHAVRTAAGVIDTLFWGAVQSGRWGTLDHRAAAFDVELGCQPAIWKQGQPWLRAGYFASSGDDNPSDKTHKTFFQMLPTPRVYAKFPFFNMINNQDAFGILVLRPHAKLTLTLEFHALRLADRRDLWQLGGGIFQPWTFGFLGRPSNNARSLANLADIGAEVRLNPHLSAASYYGHALAKSVIAGIYGPKTKNGHFGYVEMTYRF